MYEVRLNKQPQKFIQKIDSKFKDRLRALFFVLEREIVPVKHFDVKKIVGLKNTYRIRLGRYRIEYYIEEETNKIFILFIKLRKESTYK